MTWEEAIESSSLEDLPFKVELNADGNLVLSGVWNWHGGLQAEVGIRLSELMSHGKAAMEIGVRTRDNVKVADVAWFTNEHWNAVKEDAYCATAPAICIEVACGGSPAGSFERKLPLYFEAGAKEVWFCDRMGNITFHTPAGQVPASPMCPDFPVLLESPFTPLPRRSRGGHGGSAPDR